MTDPVSKVRAADLSALPSNDTAVLMERYFLKLGSVPSHIAPEKSAELVADVFHGKLWDLEARKGAPPSVQPFVSFPETWTIKVTYSGLAMVWCIALFADFMLDVVRSNRGKDEGPANIGAAMAKLRGYLDYATALRQQDLAWPRDLKPPDLDSGLEVFKETNEVFFGAVAWILLHEIAHVHLGHEPDNGRSFQQEDEADDFAAKWVFEQVSDERQREYRILAVGAALAWLLLFAPVGGDTGHPPAYARVMRVASYFGAHKDSVALEAVAHLLKALFFPSTTPPTFATPEELFDWTVMKLRELSS